MTYAVRILRAANRSLAKLPRDVHDHIDVAIDAMADNLRPAGAERLSSNEPIYRVRVGDYRILYTIDDPQQSVTIVRIGHRRDVYRGFP